MNFSKFCQQCFTHFYDENEYSKHVATCGMPVATKSVRTGRPRKESNTTLIDDPEEPAMEEETKLPTDADNEEPSLPPPEAESNVGQSDQDGTGADQLPRRPGRPRKIE